MSGIGQEQVRWRGSGDCRPPGNHYKLSLSDAISMPNESPPIPLATRLKLGLAIVGLILFAAGIRFESDRLRLIGIVAFAAAWLMRLYRARSVADAPPDSPS